MSRTLLEKFGSTGAIIAALACPICFPKLALIGTALGLGVFAPYEGYIAMGVQALFLVALAGQFFAYRSHRNKRLLSWAIGTTAVLFIGYYMIRSSVVLEIALAGLVAGSVWQIIESRRCATCATRSEVLGL